jgi:hypothetical protein
MTRDPIVEEVRSGPQEVFEACHEHLDTLLDRLQEQEKLDRERLVSDLSTQPKPHTSQQDRVRPQ